MACCWKSVLLSLIVLFAHDFTGATDWDDSAGQGEDGCQQRHGHGTQIQEEEAVDIFGLDDRVDPFANYTAVGGGDDVLLLLDDFHVKEHNSLGQWHGTSDKLAVRYRHKHLVISPDNADGKYEIQLAEPACFDLSPYQQAYLHLVVHGSTAFTISLEQNNEHCDENFSPYPETWDSVAAARYV
ncbi:hypothetical protein KEM52_005011, partial [Ascosphaera acerosa]